MKQNCKKGKLPLLIIHTYLVALLKKERGKPLLLIRWLQQNDECSSLAYY
jgi:hypothetical protein